MECTDHAASVTAVVYVLYASAGQQTWYASTSSDGCSDAEYTAQTACLPCALGHVEQRIAVLGFCNDDLPRRQSH